MDATKFSENQAQELYNSLTRLQLLSEGYLYALKKISWLYVERERDAASKRFPAKATPEEAYGLLEEAKSNLGVASHEEAGEQIISQAKEVEKLLGTYNPISPVSLGREKFSALRRANQLKDVLKSLDSFESFDDFAMGIFARVTEKDIDKNSSNAGILSLGSQSAIEITKAKRDGIIPKDWQLKFFTDRNARAHGRITDSKGKSIAFNGGPSEVILKAFRIQLQEKSLSQIPFEQFAKVAKLVPFEKTESIFADFSVGDEHYALSNREHAKILLEHFKGVKGGEVSEDEARELLSTAISRALRNGDGEAGIWKSGYSMIVFHSKPMGLEELNQLKNKVSMSSEGASIGRLVGSANQLMRGFESIAPVRRAATPHQDL